MGTIRWYKRSPMDALEGMHGLSLEERGAYNTVLDLIYARDNKLPDDERFIAGHLGVDLRVWRRVKASLMAKGKLKVVSGFVRNDRATTEVDTCLSMHLANSIAGQQSARSKGYKIKATPNEINHLTATPVVTLVPTPVATNKNKNKNKNKKEIVKKEREDKSSPKKENSLKRKTRWSLAGVPIDWLTWALNDRNWSAQQAKDESQRFIDHALANDRHQADWFAAWRQWCRSPYQKTMPLVAEKQGAWQTVVRGD